MSYIIYKNSKGEEISRKLKGRGRAPKGKVLENGDIEIVENDVSKVFDSTIKVEHKEIQEEEPVIKKNKVINFPPCISVDRLLKLIVPSSVKKVIKDDKSIKISGGYISERLDLVIGGNNGKIISEIIQFNSLYERVEIDLVNNNVKLWALPTSTAISRINNRTIKEGYVDTDEKAKEYETGDLFLEPADREVHGILILD